jgi:hypothetical protein
MPGHHRYIHSWFGAGANAEDRFPVQSKGFKVVTKVQTSKTPDWGFRLHIPRCLGGLCPGHHPIKLGLHWMGHNWNLGMQPTIEDSSKSRVPCAPGQ